MPLVAPIILIFLGTAGMLFSAIYLLFPGKTVLKERLESLADEGKGAGKTPFARTQSKWRGFLERLGKRVPLRPQEYGKYRKMLVGAGIPGEMMPVLMGFKLVFAVVAPWAYIVFYGIPARQGMVTIAAISAICAVVGFIVPSLWLSRMVKRRRLRIFNDLPDILDIMTVCVEAGLSIDASMIRIAEDEEFGKSPLAGEMKIVIRETRLGKPRGEALRDMAEKVGVDDLRSFAAMLVQTERLGTSLAESLRVHSDSLRVKRRQKAEEEAAKTTVKLVFPLVFLLFPAMFVVILIPAVIRIARLFAQF
ncbi:MAG: type II secretion system F family protein [Deltaproteobacteria bacterium]|nr:type II secretion system F family protein [Deltaproteobacteria bacterium]